ncbi:MAG: 2-C-methyl-D-erythritol 2,4-cyclodiphosphate synthase [Candidatus Omnitrophota bacterium]
MDFRVGVGYDSHRFSEGRKLFLGGIEVPFPYGLLGHSDADVVLHALCDALLGAMGKGDIGEHFPDTDPVYKGIDSKKLLGHVFALVKKERFTVCNVDIVIVAQEPNLKNFKKLMAAVIADILGIDCDRVNIKAKTNEGMGFVGNKEGIACYATAALRQ